MLDRLSAARTTCRPRSELAPGVPHNTAKSAARRGASPGPRTARSVVGESFVSEVVEGARLSVGLDLSIPNLAIEFSVPTAKLTEFPVGQGGDVALEFLNLGHNRKLARRSAVA